VGLHVGGDFSDQARVCVKLGVIHNVAPEEAVVELHRRAMRDATYVAVRVPRRGR
jgi:hypothetical protein